MFLYTIMWHLNSVKGHKYISWQWNMISHPCDASSPTKSIPRTSKTGNFTEKITMDIYFWVGPVVLKMWKDTMIGFGSSCTHMLLHTPKGGIIIWCIKRWTSIWQLVLSTIIYQYKELLKLRVEGNHLIPNHDLYEASPIKSPIELKIS